jgi:hypothetical protein
MCLEFLEEEEEEGHASGPTLSASTTTGSAKSRKKSDLNRGQHERHQVSKKVHAILRIGPHGEPLELESVIGTFGNQYSCIVKEHMPITYSNWKKVSETLKEKVWTDVKSHFQYPPEQYDEALCRGMHCI